MPDLSVVIPSRNEEWLRLTVEDILRNARADTEVIVILDGAWPTEPLEKHDKVTLVYHPKSVGQRAATNEGVRLSDAKYIAKADAHCSFAEGFDVALIKAAEELGPDVTQIPAQKNLHIWDWLCECGHRWYQGPKKPCDKCKGTNARREIVWKPRRGVTTTCWRFDSSMHFQYAGEMGKRPTLRHGDFIDTMCCLGAFFFMERQFFWRLGGMDCGHGSWGGYGCELGCKSWLSGGRMVCNTRTWFAHLFRTGGLGFPYEIHGSDQEKARQYSRDLWLNNRWPGQKYPLSWLIERFKPVPDWHDPSGAARLADVVAADAAFTSRQKHLLSGRGETGELPSIETRGATTASPPALGEVSEGRERMALGAVSPSGFGSGGPLSTKDIGSDRDETQVGRVAAALDVASMVNDESVHAESPRQWAVEPRTEDAVDVNLRALGPSGRPADSGVSTAGVDVPGPQPATSAAVDGDLPEDAGQHLAVEVGNDENLRSHSESPSQTTNRSGPVAAPAASGPSILHPPTKGVVFYTENRLDPVIAEACRAQLRRAVNGTPIVSVSINGPCDLGRNIQLPLERSYLSMFEQILRGLEEQDAEVIFLCEHDVLYDPSHFQFTPPRADTYYYNLNVYKVDAQSGHALHYITRQTSGLCAYRTLLLDHYRRRVERVKREGFSRKMGFEAGTHGRPERIDDFGCGDWWSAVPNIDIRHSHNLTPSRWKTSDFRSQRNCRGWTESTEVPGWGRTEGRFAEFLQDVVKG